MNNQAKEWHAKNKMPKSPTLEQRTDWHKKHAKNCGCRPIPKEYYQKLGLAIKFDFSDNGMVAYKVGSQEPAIILKDTKNFPNAKPTIWFVVDNVRAEYKKLKENGISFLSEPFEIYTGLAIEFEDPFGNRLGITDYSKQKEK